jgi:hypothetical protein
MRSEIIEYTEGKFSITVSFERSEDHGYTPGALVAETPIGETIRITRKDSQWSVSFINSGSRNCWRQWMCKTKSEALQSAAQYCLGEKLHLEALSCY